MISRQPNTTNKNSQHVKPFDLPTTVQILPDCELYSTLVAFSCSGHNDFEHSHTAAGYLKYLIDLFSKKALEQCKLLKMKLKCIISNCNYCN